MIDSNIWKPANARSIICRNESGRRGRSRARKMKNCVWLKPELVAQIEFAEWRWRTNYGILGLLGCGEGKAVISCNNPLKPDMSGLSLGRPPVLRRLRGWLP